nr:unnamed protein product [Digitaria exilis]
MAGVRTTHPRYARDEPGRIESSVRRRRVTDSNTTLCTAFWPTPATATALSLLPANYLPKVIHPSTATASGDQDFLTGPTYLYARSPDPDREAPQPYRSIEMSVSIARDRKYVYSPNKNIILGYDHNHQQVQQHHAAADDDEEEDDYVYDDSGEAPSVDAQDIDAGWLENKVWQAYGASEIDWQQTQDLAHKILKAMAPDGTNDDDRVVENRLAALLDYDKFDLIRLLLHNRLKIVCCTRSTRPTTAPQDPSEQSI